MARRSVPFPPSLQRRAFTVAEAIDAGVTRRTLENSGLAKPHHGVRRVSGGAESFFYPEELMRQKALDYAPLLRPGEAFSHTSALLLLGAPILTEPHIHVTAPTPAKMARGRGIRGHSSSLPFPLASSDGGLPCVSPSRALEQAANILNFRELVVAIDSFIRPQSSTDREYRDDGSSISLDELQEGARGARSRSIRLYRDALKLARVGSESRMETLLRLELELVGITDLELQVDVFDNDGVWIGRFDLVDLERRRIVEYDGEQHRFDRSQYLKDQNRIGRAGLLGSKYCD